MPNLSLRNYNVAVFTGCVVSLAFSTLLFLKMANHPNLDQLKLFKVLSNACSCWGALMLSHYAITSEQFVEAHFPRIAGLLVGGFAFLATGAMIAGLMQSEHAPNGPILMNFGMMATFLVALPMNFLWGEAFNYWCKDSLARVKATGFMFVAYGQVLQLGIAGLDAWR